MESESLQVEAGQRVLYEHTKVSSIPRSCSAARYRLQHSSKCASPVDCASRKTQCTGTYSTFSAVNSIKPKLAFKSSR